MFSDHHRFSYNVIGKSRYKNIIHDMSSMNKNAIAGISVILIIIIVGTTYYFMQNKTANIELQRLVEPIIKQSSGEETSSQEAVENSVREEMQEEEQYASPQQPAAKPMTTDKSPLSKPTTHKEETIATPPTKQVQAPTSFIVVPGQSNVSFQLDELLFGSPKTVIGTTSSVNGEIIIDRRMPSRSSIKRMAIDARTFATDSDQRDNQIRKAILKSEVAGNEFITFVSRSINGLSTELKDGTSYFATIRGDLTIAGVTREAIFNGSFSLKNNSTIEGTALSTIKRSDFGIVIPNLSFIANVDEEVKLSISFKAINQ